MKIECQKDLLSDVVQKIEKITAKNLTLPVLSGILITVKNNSLILRATNLDIGAEFEIVVKVESEGSLVVPGSVFSMLLSGIQGDKKITLEEKDGNLSIHTSSNSAIVKCFPKDEFPTLPTISSGESFSIPVNTLIDGMKSVVYSSSLSDVKPELSSVYMYPDGQDVFFVATDSFRLAEKKYKIKNTKDWGGVIIPFKNVISILKIFEGLSGDIDVLFNKNQIVFSLKDIYVSSRVVDGNFPDYKQIIPKEYKTKIVLLKQDLINALKIGNIFSGKFNQAVLDVSPQKSKMSIEIKNSDVGENKSSLQATLDGSDVVISFNYKYVLDCLQSINSDSVSIACNDSNMPIVLSGVGDNSFTYLLMPINR